jgi:hypothetical protein
MVLAGEPAAARVRAVRARLLITQPPALGFAGISAQLTERDPMGKPVDLPELGPAAYWEAGWLLFSFY